MMQRISPAEARIRFPVRHGPTHLEILRQMLERWSPGEAHQARGRLLFNYFKLSDGEIILSYSVNIIEIRLIILLLNFKSIEIVAIG